MKFYTHVNLYFIVLSVGFLNAAASNQGSAKMKEIHEKYEAVRNELNNVVAFQKVPVEDSHKWAKKIEALRKEFEDFSTDVKKVKKIKDKKFAADEMIRRADRLKSKIRELSQDMKKHVVELPQMPWEK